MYANLSGSVVELGWNFYCDIIANLLLVNCDWNHDLTKITAHKKNTYPLLLSVPNKDYWQSCY